MSEEKEGPDAKQEEVCSTQKEAAIRVEAELGQTQKRLLRAKIAPICTFAAYAFNCDKHNVKDLCHFEWVAVGGKQEIPGSLQVVIQGLEHLLATLKEKVQ